MERFAVYKNTGSGVAINISQTNMFTTYSDDNVLAPNQETTLRIPLKTPMVSPWPSSSRNCRVMAMPL